MQTPHDNLLYLMTVAYDAACFDLGITKSDDDADRRNQVANFISDMAQAGVRDPEVMRQRVITHLHEIALH